MDPFVLRELMSGLQSDHEQGESPGWRLCRACVDLIAVSGAGIMLRDDAENGTSLGFSDDVAGKVEDLQFTLGEGPGIDAHSFGRPILGPRLDDPDRSPWPTFAPAAVGAGVLGAFGFPLRVGVIRLGSLDLYNGRSGDLEALQLADAIAMADVVTSAVITVQESAGTGSLADEMDNPGDLRTVVHQASGMISRQLDITVRSALVRLRAYAYSEGRSINDVAREVVTRQLRFE
jgi:ANTAR domain-containing protein